MNGYSWKDRTYESIPKRNIMTRAYWLMMEAMHRDRQLTRREAEQQAWARIQEEDHPQLELVG